MVYSKGWLSQAVVKQNTVNHALLELYEAAVALHHHCQLTQPNQAKSCC